MKKSSLQSVATYLTENNALLEIRDEILAELSKGEAKAENNRNAYKAIHDAVIAALTSSAPMAVTAQEIAEETGIARGKITYGIKNYWSDEIVVDNSGKVNKYSLK